MQQRPDEQRERTGKDTAQECVRRDGAGGVPLERVDEVIQRGLEDSKEAQSYEDGADAWCNPVDVGRRGPGEDEEPGAETQTAHHHGG